MKNKMWIIVALLLVIIGGGSFFAGMKYQQNKSPRAFGQGFDRQGTGRQNGQFTGGARGGIRPVNGEIISQDDKSITVKLADGSSRIILLSDKTTIKTTINKAAEATKSDLKTGEKVAVFGQENADGSVTAQSVQINPVLRVNVGSSQP